MRKVAVLAASFYGIRRAAELFCNADRSMRLMVIIPGKRIALFIRSMKNNTYAAGHIIFWSWLTASGVELGVLFTAYMSQLQADGISKDFPFLAPTSSCVFQRVSPGKTSRFNHVVRNLLCEFFPRLTTVQLAEYFFHSLRRGGATWARSRSVPSELVLEPGLWNSKVRIPKSWPNSKVLVGPNSEVLVGSPNSKVLVVSSSEGNK